ncbi:MAG: hypothetical protein AB1585_17885, partial [Thermodesulfobacteriota bacterium]
MLPDENYALTTMYYFLFRKILYTLLILAGIGIVFLVAQSYFLPRENPPAADVVVQRPLVQEKVPLPTTEAKADLKTESLPEIKNTFPLQERVPGPQPPLLSKAPPPANPPAPIESNTAPPQVKADPKPIPPPIPKEAPKESKPETRPQNLGSTNGLKK